MPRQSRHLFRSKAISVLLRILQTVYSVRLHSYSRLSDLLNRFRNSKSTGVSTADSIALYEAVLFRLPQCILELGPGTSSAVIALAIKQAKTLHAGYRPRFIGVEESVEWLAFHKEHFPAELSDNVELMHSDVAVREIAGQRAAFYRSVPQLPFDFVHVDGPDFLKVGCRVSCDIVNLKDSLAATAFIVFDGREDSARLARPFLELLDFRLSRHPFTLSYQFERVAR
jgi:hypothetical protein